MHNHEKSSNIQEHKNTNKIAVNNKSNNLTEPCINVLDENAYSAIEDLDILRGKESNISVDQNILNNLSNRKTTEFITGDYIKVLENISVERGKHMNQALDKHDGVKDEYLTATIGINLFQGFMIIKLVPLFRWQITERLI